MNEARRVHLDLVDVPDPCTEDWSAMRGDDVSRYCGLCRENVYDLSGMSREEAERLVGESEGGVCVRFYKRADGTVVTKDCAPDRLAAARRAARKGLAVMGAAMAGMMGIVGALGFASMNVAGTRLQAAVDDLLRPEPILVMGAVTDDSVVYEPHESDDEAPEADTDEGASVEGESGK